MATEVSCLGSVPVRSPNGDADVLVPEVPSPVLRVAVLRGPGRVFRFLAADAAQQLREDGNVVVATGVDRFVVDEADIGNQRPGDAFDLVLQIGSPVPAAVRLAARLGIPLLRLDTPWPMAVADVVRGALAGEARVQPLLEIELDGASSFKLGDRAVVRPSPTELRLLAPDHGR